VGLRFVGGIFFNRKARKGKRVVVSLSPTFRQRKREKVREYLCKREKKRASLTLPPSPYLSFEDPFVFLFAFFHLDHINL
jgi:hypothetical protein